MRRWMALKELAVVGEGAVAVRLEPFDRVGESHVPVPMIRTRAA